MRSIDSDLKTGQFKQIYLLYGAEAYLIRMYKERLVKAILAGADEMNLTRYVGRDVDCASLIETADTLPFFADRRVILIEETGLLEKKNERLENLLADLPETTYMIFTEESVDKRKSLYKLISKSGGAVELNMPDEKALARWMLKRVQKEGLSMTRAAWESFYIRSGESMDNMSNEMDKLIDFCRGKEAIHKADVDTICMNWMEGRMYDMLDALAGRDIKKTLELYRDMLVMHEDPLRIMAAMRSQFMRLLLLKEMNRHRESDKDISKRTKIPMYFIGKSRRLAGNFSTEELKKLLIEIGNTEADMKTGRVNPQVGLELILIKYASLKDEHLGETNRWQKE